MTAIGIDGIGVAVPRTRLSARSIHDVWRNIPWSVVERSGVRERSVCEADMDAITLAVDAASMAVAGAPRIDAVFLGTQTGPYLSRAGAAIVVDALGLGPDVFATDLQFAGKSGTAALVGALAWVGSGLGQAALAIGSDTLGVHAAPGDPYEYAAGSGAVALVVTHEPTIATVDAVASYTSDTADGFRLDGERFFHRGGATMTVTDVGFPSHARGAWKAASQRAGVSAADLDFAAMQQPDAQTPLRVGTELGFERSKVEPGLVCRQVGDTGAASALLGLARILSRAATGQRVALISYGVGAGSDAFVLSVKEPAATGMVERLIDRRQTVEYAIAVRLERRYDGHQRLVATYE